MSIEDHGGAWRAAGIFSKTMASLAEKTGEVDTRTLELAELPVALYHPTGRSLLLSAMCWRRALECARMHGWSPAGTLAPPRGMWELDEENWSGDYERPLGQEVRREDARLFGEALGVAGDAEFGGLREFSLVSGFLVCEAATQQGMGQGLSLLATAVGFRREQGIEHRRREKKIPAE